MNFLKGFQVIFFTLKIVHVVVKITLREDMNMFDQVLTATTFNNNKKLAFSLIALLVTYSDSMELSASVIVKGISVSSLELKVQFL